MTGKPRPTEPVALPVREKVWHEVRCPKCGMHLFNLTAGSEGSKQCPRCKTWVEREIPQQEAA